MDEKKNGFFNRIKNDFEFRTHVTSTVSFFVTLAFTVYNVFLGIAYRTAWNIGIAVYYALLTGVRAFVGYKEIRFKKLKLSEEEKEERRKSLFLVQSVMLFLIDAALIVPITVMVMQEKSVNYTEIPAIAMAAYSVFKIVSASVSFVKTRKAYNLGVRTFKNLNFIDALVSILALQYTLITTFGSGVEGSMLTLCSITSFVIWVSIIAVSVTNLIKAVKIKKAG